MAQDVSCDLTPIPASVKPTSDEMVAPEPDLSTDNGWLELTLLWEGRMLDVRHFRAHSAIRIGESEACDVVVAADQLPDSIVELVQHREGAWMLTTWQGLDGSMEIDGQRWTIDELRCGSETAGEGVLSFALHLRSVTTVTLGDVSLRLRLVPPSPRPTGWLPQEINYSFLNVALLSMFVHVGLLGATHIYSSTGPTAPDALLSSVPNRFAQFLVVPATPPRDSRISNLLQIASSGRAAAAAAEAQGRAGDPRSDDTGKRLAFKGPKLTDEAKTRRQLGMLFGEEGSGGIGAIFGGGLGGDLEEALGAVTGPTIGASHGNLGLGTRGHGPGGGGRSLETYGIGTIGTRGRGAGELGYGSAGGALRPHGDRGPVVVPQPIEVSDAFDKDLIRQVIRSHIAEIRYCYERELTSSPGLHGKVSVRFVIGANGRVTAAQVQQSTMGNPEVEGCITHRVRSWRFPAPRGGGIGVITYPFLFKPSG